MSTSKKTGSTQTSTSNKKPRIELLEKAFRYGFFRAHREAPDDYWKIGAFFIKQEFRGKGFARRLAKHLPKRCSLYAEPFDNATSGLELKALKRFYRSLGFKTVRLGGSLMVREGPKEGSQKRGKKPL